MQEFLEETVQDKKYNCSILARQNDGFLVKLEDMQTAENLSDIINRCPSTA